MKHMFKKSMVGLALAALSASAQAVPTLTSIGNFNILGTDYAVSLLSDVSYENQSFNDLSPSITFTTVAAATTAVNVLFSALGASYNWNPTCASCQDGFRVAYATTATTYSYVTGYVGGAPNGPFTFGRNDGNNFSFAQFTARNTTVPEPATLALFGLGMIGLGFARLTRKS